MIFVKIRALILLYLRPFVGIAIHRHMSTNTARTAEVVRNTSETQITVKLNLDGTGKTNFDTGVPFPNI